MELSFCYETKALNKALQNIPINLQRSATNEEGCVKRVDHIQIFKLLGWLSWAKPGSKST